MKDQEDECEDASLVKQIKFIWI